MSVSVDIMALTHESLLAKLPTEALPAAHRLRPVTFSLPRAHAVPAQGNAPQPDINAKNFEL